MMPIDAEWLADIASMVLDTRRHRCKQHWRLTTIPRNGKLYVIGDIDNGEGEPTCQVVVFTPEEFEDKTPVDLVDTISKRIDELIDKMDIGDVLPFEEMITSVQFD